MNIDIVVVTYNRLEKLKKALSCYEKQTMSFRNLILVNNCSTDGTTEYVDEWAKKDAFFNKIVITTNENLGGSGGFYLGQKKALELGADWVFVADDDAYPSENLVEEFYLFTEKENAREYSAVCGKVLYTDGTICYGHRCHLQKKWNSVTKLMSQDKEYEQSMFEIDLFSYVGSFINTKAMIRYGTVRPEYFIYFDDSEHSLRIRKYGKLVCVPSIEIIHDDRTAASNINPNVMVSWRDYYSVRNQYHMVSRHFPFIGLNLFLLFILSRAKRILLKRSSPIDKVIEEAKRDGFCGKLGKHVLYRPGWEIRK